MPSELSKKAAWIAVLGVGIALLAIAIAQASSGIPVPFGAEWVIFTFSLSLGVGWTLGIAYYVCRNWIRRE
jgi:hypothetical protein